MPDWFPVGVRSGSLPMQEVCLEPTELLRNWDLPEITRCTRLRAGINNQSWRVDTGGSAAYVFRVYRNAVTPQRIGFEHRMLQGLSLAGLDFAVPARLATRDGSTWA